jgi:hypothetical protein
MLFNKIIAVYTDHIALHISRPTSEGKMQLLNVNAGGIHNYHSVLKD